MAFNYKDRALDFTRYAVGSEEWTLRVSGLPDVALPSVLAQPVSSKQALPADGSVAQGDVVALWPVAASQQPPLGSTLLDGNGTVWTILTVTRKQLVQTWECTARNLAVAYRLDNLVTLLRATYVKSSAGEAIPVWTTLQADIRARVQPISQTVSLRENADWTQDDHRIVCESLPHLPLAAGDFRVVDSLGVRYRITGFEQAERIDELPALLAQRIYEGAEGRLGSSSSGA